MSKSEAKTETGCDTGPLMRQCQSQAWHPDTPGTQRGNQQAGESGKGDEMKELVKKYKALDNARHTLVTRLDSETSAVWQALCDKVANGWVFQNLTRQNCTCHRCAEGAQTCGYEINFVAKRSSEPRELPIGVGSSSHELRWTFPEDSEVEVSEDEDGFEYFFRYGKSIKRIIKDLVNEELAKTDVAEVTPLRAAIGEVAELLKEAETWPGSGEAEVSKEEYELAYKLGLQTSHSPATCGDEYDDQGEPERFYIQYREEV
jgi:hypothetical protein